MRGPRFLSVRIAVSRAGEQPENIGWESGIDDGGVGEAFLMNNHPAGQGAEVGGQGALGGPDGVGGQFGQTGVGGGGHGTTVG